jgi:starch phosphorylase
MMECMAEINGKTPHVAYFSMEIGITDEIKTYAGGLGILAGDTLKTAADMGVNMVGVTLLYSRGYFKQVIGENGEQIETADEWDYSKLLQKTNVRIPVLLANETIYIDVYKYDVKGIAGHVVPVYFLFTDIPENSDQVRYASYNLYTPFENTRLIQEVILGIGGVKALQALGHDVFDSYHFNESHAALGVLAVEELVGSRDKAIQHIVFTTHTPAEHGHLVHNRQKLERLLHPTYISYLHKDFADDGTLHMTKFCLSNSKFSNAVSLKHSQVSSEMFHREIPGITNGIHTRTWTSRVTKKVLDKYIPNWQVNSDELQKAINIPVDTILAMHRDNKHELFQFIKKSQDISLDENVFTIGFGRRVDGYKRSGFLFSDFERLKKIAHELNGLQIIYSGKAYFDYRDGEDHIAFVRRLSESDLGVLKIVYIPDYNMSISQLMIQGCDVWLNNPIKPLEASGTSGMKAALNGVPNLSTIDGWWVEGLKEGITGWAIGNETENDEQAELNDMYSKLQDIIIPMYLNDAEAWATVMKSAIALNASHFSSQRMLTEYLLKAY